MHHTRITATVILFDIRYSLISLSCSNHPEVFMQSSLPIELLHFEVAKIELQTSPNKGVWGIKSTVSKVLFATTS